MKREEREDLTFPGADGIEIAAYRWPASVPPIGVLQIAHGAAEHAIRYAPAAEFFSKAGFHTYANDHRGHGRTAKRKEQLGDFGTGGWNALVEDMAALTRLAQRREGGLPVVALGHSMGSFALQQYLLDYSTLLAGAIISGSASFRKLELPDSSKPVALSSFNQAFEPARTPFDWLSRDPAEVDKYVADPLCGFDMPAQSMQEMRAARMQLTDPKQLARIRKDLPIYIVAGDADPLNNKLESLRPLADAYRAAGIRSVTEKYYAGGRHEMLNETNRDEVMSDLLNWLKSVRLA